jgi:hypothetical protein
MSAHRVACCLLLVACAFGAQAQTEWTLAPEVPVIERGEDEDWDRDRSVFGVVKVDGTYHMFYVGRTAGYQSPSIGHATSTDGVSWLLDPANPVLGPGDPGDWDEMIQFGGAVLHDGSEFHMWYTGVESVPPSRHFLGRGGYATSPDGSTWTKHPANPVLDADFDGSFEQYGVSPQAAVAHDGLLHMWYTTGFGTVHYASSDDGLSWVKRPEPVLEYVPGDLVGGYSMLAVAFDGDRYHMIYQGMGWNWLYYMGYAVSGDGLLWANYARRWVVRTHLFTRSPALVLDPNTAGFELFYSGGSIDPPWGIFRAASACCSTVHSWFIPAAAYGAGTQGAMFTTAVDLSNAGAEIAEVRLAWLPRGSDNSDWQWSEFLSLQPNETSRIDNVAAEVFGLEADVFGSLLIESSSEDVIAAARISSSPGDGVGSYGQSVPAVRRHEFAALGERRRILFATEDAGMRFNLGCQSAHEYEISVNLELFDADGTSLATDTITFAPWGNEQVHRIFGPYRPIAGSVDVWTDTSWGIVYCYGSVLDNLTNDPTTILPR